MFELLQRMLEAARLQGYAVVYKEQGQFPSRMLWSHQHRGPGIAGPSLMAAAPGNTGWLVGGWG